VAIYVHSAIVVTGSDDDTIAAARREAKRVGLPITENMIGRNGYSSFMVPPSGGAGPLYAASEAHVTAIATFCAWLEGQIRLDFVAIVFGREHGKADVLADCASPYYAFNEALKALGSE